MNQINIALLFMVIGCAIVIAIQNYRIKQKEKTIEQGNQYYKRLLNENVALTNEFERAKKTVIHQENVIKYFCRLVDDVPEIEKAYKDLIGGNEN
jgi:hypothetical protein